MNPEIKAQWVAALRSGTYDQGQDYLHTRNDTYCCLGVLCDLAVKAGVIDEPQQDNSGDSWTYTSKNAAGGHDSSDTRLPEGVKEWAGLSDMDPAIKGPVPETGRYSVALADLNDNGMSFDDLSNLIEKYL